MLQIACSMCSVGPISACFGEGEGKEEGVAFDPMNLQNRGACKPRRALFILFGVHPLGASSFSFNKPFCLQNCFAHSPDRCSDQGKDPRAGNKVQLDCQSHGTGSLL